jgi:putative phosphoesterase
MKVGVLSDIHGNYDSLKAVLESAKKKEVEHLFILGDIVGYYYHPDKILNELSSWSCDFVKGNHEYILDTFMDDPSVRDAIRKKYGSGHHEASLKLTGEQLSFLKNLPEKKTCYLNNISFLLCHGSPWRNDFYIYPDSDLDTLKMCNSITHDFVLIGHTHYSFTYKNENSLLVNPGSVGQSRQLGGKASWAIIDTGNKSVQLMSTPYSTEKLLSEIAQRDHDIKYLSNILKRTS